MIIFTFDNRIKSIWYQETENSIWRKDRELDRESGIRI